MTNVRTVKLEMKILHNPRCFKSRETLDLLTDEAGGSQLNAALDLI